MYFAVGCIVLAFALVIQCSVAVPKVLLNNGVKIPILGLGTSTDKASGIYQPVKDAIDVGYRHFDGAYSYGNEKEIGQAIAEKIAEGAVKREDLFITSKLWNNFHKPELVEVGLNASLKNLGLDYVDLYLIHFPIAHTENNLELSDDDYVDTWIAMEKVYKKGLAKSIGISNFNKKQIERILEIATVVPVTNQVFCQPQFNQHKLIEFCKSKNITVTAYSPLGGNKPPLGKYKLLDEPKIKTIAEKYRKTPAQIVLRYQIERGVIAIPKSVHKNRLIENMQIFDFNLDGDDMEIINSLDGPRVNFWGNRYIHHKFYPFTDEY